MNGEYLLEDFQFESEEGKKGFHNFAQFLQQNGRGKTLDVDLALFSAYIIQKNHEAHIWWLETLGTQIGLLQQEICQLRKELQDRDFYRGKF